MGKIILILVFLLTSVSLADGKTFTLAANLPGSGVRPTGFCADDMTLIFEFRKR